MFLALLIIAAVFIVIAIIQKNWIYAVVALGCVVIALLLGHHGRVSKVDPAFPGTDRTARVDAVRHEDGWRYTIGK